MINFEDVFSVVFTILIIAFVVGKKSGKRFSRTRSFRSPSMKHVRIPDLKDKISTSEYVSASAPSSEGKFKNAPIFMEDRANDWLARQLREEQRVLRRGETLDLGASHQADCDARSLKLSHLMAHDDSIDDGEL